MIPSLPQKNMLGEESHQFLLPGTHLLHPWLRLVPINAHVQLIDRAMAAKTLLQRSQRCHKGKF